jgi:hypothetical protein
MSPGKDAIETGGGLQQAAATDGLFGWRRHAPQVAIALALATALLALLVTLNLLQLTAPAPAHRALRRAVASLTEIDSLLAAHGATLRQQADVSPDEPLSLPDYPLDVWLSPEEARLPAAEVRDLLLDRSAEQVYQKGSAAFREEGQSGDAPRLSVQRAVRTGLGFLTAGNHDALRWATLVLAAVCGVLSGTLVLVTRGYGRLSALGGAVAAASLLFLLLAAAVRLVFGLAGWGTDDYITVQLLDLAKEATWLPLRNGLAFSGLGLVLLALGVVGSGLSRSAAQGLPAEGPRS